MLEKLRSKSGKDLISTLFNQAWRLISGPLSLLLIPLYLTDTQQGYWYLFGSIAALSAFADLGFTNIILQFSAHEFAFLKIENNLEIVGEENNIKKLGSFFRFVIKWISVMCLITYPIIFFVGVFFFMRDGVLLIYLIPWIIYSIGSLLNFFNNSILSFIEGMNQVSKIQKSRLIVSIISTFCIVGGLLLRFNIYASAIAMILSSSFMFFTIFHTFGKIVKKIWNSSKDYFYPWKNEILPLFKRYVLSFASGYFIFQIYTPLMHLFHGPVYSGKVGLSMSLVNAIVNFSNIWIYTVTPQINILIEQRNWKELDKIFYKRLILTFFTYIGLTLSFFCFIAIFGNNPFISKVVSRFLPIKGLLILLLCYFLQLFVSAWAVYLRGHKEEPYWWTSIVSAIWVLIITLLVGKFLPPDYFFIGLLTNYIWGLPLCYYIFCKKKNYWHDI